MCIRDSISYMPPTYSFFKKVMHPQKSLLDLRQLILPLPAGLTHLLTNLEIFLNIRKYIHPHFPRFRWLRIRPKSLPSGYESTLTVANTAQSAAVVDRKYGDGSIIGHIRGRKIESSLEVNGQACGGVFQYVIDFVLRLDAVDL